MKSRSGRLSVLRVTQLGDAFCSLGDKNLSRVVVCIDEALSRHASPRRVLGLYYDQRVAERSRWWDYKNNCRCAETKEAVCHYRQQ